MPPDRGIVALQNRARWLQRPGLVPELRGESCDPKTPRELLALLQSIEKQLGRTARIKNGPRTIDLDILLYDRLVMEEDGLVIPHPRMHERLFVLAPLREIAPGLVHPVSGKTMEELADSLRNPERVEVYEASRYQDGDGL